MSREPQGSGGQERSPHVATLKSLCEINQAAKSGRSEEEVLCQAQSFRRAEWLRCGPELPRPEKSFLVLQPTCVWGLGALWNQLGHTLIGSNSWKLLQRPLCWPPDPLAESGRAEVAFLLSSCQALLKDPALHGGKDRGKLTDFVFFLSQVEAVGSVTMLRFLPS